MYGLKNRLSDAAKNILNIAHFIAEENTLPLL